MANIILGSIIFGTVIYIVVKKIKDRNNGSCCDGCACPIKEQQNK